MRLCCVEKSLSESFRDLQAGSLQLPHLSYQCLERQHAETEAVCRAEADSAVFLVIVVNCENL